MRIPVSISILYWFRILKVALAFEFEFIQTTLYSIGFDDFCEASKNKTLKDIAVFTSASEGFSIKNTNCSVSESLRRLKSVAEAAKERGVRVRGYVSCIAKCPYDGKIDPESVLRVTEGLLAMGCYEVSLGDTIGAATPGDIERVLNRLITSGINVDNLAIHCHDTYGQALANILLSLQVRFM